jgi:hypothetical protein
MSQYADANMTTALAPDAPMYAGDGFMLPGHPVFSETACPKKIL